MDVDGEYRLVVKPTAAVIGAGPAGLFAAEHLAARGFAVTVYERMPSPARKLLMAGRGGLNITHSEPFDRFISRYGVTDPRLIDALTAFPPQAMMAWLEELGIATFTGSSGRIFPKAMKSSPLVRAWLRRLADAGVTLLTSHTWTGFTGERGLSFLDAAGAPLTVTPDVTVLALGGASWPRLGSDGSWTGILGQAGAAITPLAPSNCGVITGWTEPLARFAGVPLKRIALSCANQTVRGEAILTRSGLEGGAVYALSQAVRAALLAQGEARLTLDLRPDVPLAAIAERLARPREKMSTSTYLRKTLHLTPADIAILREAGPLPSEPGTLAARIKACPLTVTRFTGLERAISTAGGVAFSAVDGNFMLPVCPGVFAAGEMLDWDAPTGGYLLQATFATGLAAAEGAARWFDRNSG